MLDWLLIFIWANGQVYASGPFDLETCKANLAAWNGTGACVHKDHPTRRAVEKKFVPEVENKS